MEPNYNKENQSHMPKKMVTLMLNNLIKEVKDSENAHKLLIKAELVEEDFEIENNPLESLENTNVNGIILEPEVVEQMENVGVVDQPYGKVTGRVAAIKQELEEIVPMESSKTLENSRFNDSHCTVLSTASYKSKEFASKQLVVLLVRTENYLTKSEIEKFPEVDYDDWKIKNEEVDLKEEDMLENLVRSKDCGSQQIEVLKTENSKINDKNEKWAEVVYEEWKMKNEEVELKEEHLLENEIRSKEFSTKQLVVLLERVENSVTKSETVKFPEVVYKEWKMKNEEVDLKDEDLLENLDSLPSGLCEQEEYDNNKKYKCHVCNYQTERNCDLKSHLLIHKKPKEVDLFRCGICKYVTHYKNVFKNHLQLHENPEELDLFRCDKCKFKTRNKNSFRNHSLKHKDPEELNLFRCDKCKYQTRYKSNLKKHFLKHQSSEKVDLFSCDKCEYRTTDKSNLKKHLLKHQSPEELNLFQCDKCEYRTRLKTNLKRHGLSHQSPEGVVLFRCDKCKFVTRHKYSFKDHSLKHKDPEELNLFRCDKCEFQTRYKRNLKRHCLKHQSPEELNLFRCDKCEYRTPRKGDLKTHFLKHRSPEEVDLFRCDKCKFVTRHKYSFKDHSLKHKDPEELNLFRCDKCEYRTRFKSDLKKHFLRHDHRKN